MKNTLLPVLLMMLISVGYATGHIHKNKKYTHKQPQITAQFNTLIGYPTELLHDSKQTVIISYSIDASDILYIKEVSTSNEDLKNYIIHRLDGKKIKHSSEDQSSGVVKLEFMKLSTKGVYNQY
ncbi:MAG: hypothetical protein H7259_07435 [Cytophagales bacterium]|nr:hypothetical protein [Cytophaga sp.]